MDFVSNKSNHTPQPLFLTYIGQYEAGLNTNEDQRLD